MSKKSTEGFTKGAQNKKFVRNRDIKLKGKEIKRESHIQKLMCEGVCKRCREKVQWRFQYDKYKPLKNPATCQGCKNKTVTKAYRTLCDKCATNRKVCAGCVGTLLEDSDTNEAGVDDNEVMNEDDMDHNQDSHVGEGDDGNDNDDDDDDDEYNHMIDDDDDDENNEDDNEKNNHKPQHITSYTETLEPTTSSIQLLTKDNPNTSNNDTTITDDNTQNVSEVWDEKKFINFASQKYNKNRVIGSTNDVHISLSNT